MEGGVAPGSIPHDLTGAFCAAHSPQLSCSRRHCPLSTHTLASPGCRCMSLQNLQLTESEHDINLVWLTLVTSVFLRWSSSVQSLHQMSRRGEHDKTIQQRSSSSLFCNSHCEQFWKGCPLFDIAFPAFLQPSMGSPTLRGALKDGFGEAVMACDTMTQILFFLRWLQLHNYK